MTVKEITALLQEQAPLSFAEDFDNVGLLVGDPSMKVNGILVTLDTPINPLLLELDLDLRMIPAGNYYLQFRLLDVRGHWSSVLRRPCSGAGTSRESC